MGEPDRWNNIWIRKRGLVATRLGEFFAKDVIYRTVRDILQSEIPDSSGQHILEAGSGTGLVSLDLAIAGAHVLLLDLSSEALELSRSFFASEGLEPSMVQASILALPFKDVVFDVTWSAGVIEHFHEDEQIAIVKEMARVTKPKGKIILIAPSSQATTYLKAKRYADARSAWQPGHEIPITSFKQLAEKSGVHLDREYRTGRLAELHFLKYYFARWRPLWLGWCGFVEILSRLLGPLNNLPGYLLVGVLSK